MAIAEVAGYAHLSGADIEALAAELEAIRVDIGRSQDTNVKLRALAEQVIADVRTLTYDDDSLPSRAAFDQLLLTRTNASQPKQRRNALKHSPAARPPTPDPPVWRAALSLSGGGQYISAHAAFRGGNPFSSDGLGTGLTQRPVVRWCWRRPLA
jgi:hypothetical protein